ncbi:MAG: hypothetical protein IPL96_11345 [Holophagaceae bacterium]|nr:hypothetical protein [Holophagaceae bacterium]
MAEKVENLYRLSGVSLNNSSSLFKLIKDSKSFSDAWLVNETDLLGITTLFRVCHAYRISIAILGLENEPNISHHLEKLASGNLDLLCRKASAAKNYLWEVEMFTTFKEKNCSPTFAEPDLKIEVSGIQVGVACKKIHSEKHIQNIMSEAVAQIAAIKGPGIVALNIDDLYPPEAILKANDASSISEILNNGNRKFISRHERHLRKYLESSRISACIISSSLVGDALSDSPRINNFSEMTCWSIPNIGKERQRIADGIFSKFKFNGNA